MHGRSGSTTTAGSSGTDGVCGAGGVGAGSTGGAGDGWAQAIASNATATQRESRCAPPARISLRFALLTLAMPDPRTWLPAAGLALIALFPVLLVLPARSDPDASAQLMPLFGRAERVLVAEGETLLQIAFDHRVGFEALQRLNPEVDPWIPDPGTMVQLPTHFVLPSVEPTGLIINVPEMRLFDFSVEPFRVYAVAVGDPDDPSPIGRFRVGTKRIDPAWRVPESIQRERPSLPAVVPPGPDNPLGSRWMTIGATSYGIHGTSTRWSIGRMATHGCVRLYDDEVQRLFEEVPTGTPVELVYEPYKWGVHRGALYFEAHRDLYGRVPDPLSQALRVPRALGLLPQIDIEAVWSAIESADGAPRVVGRLPAPERATSRPRS